MSARRCFVLTLLLPVVAVAGACGYQAEPEDREYMTSFCVAIDEFSDALVRSDAGTALDQLAEDLSRIQAPARLEEFHREFLAYVRQVRAEPGSLATSRPPRPEADVRNALADIESDLEECWEASFFGGTS